MLSDSSSSPTRRTRRQAARRSRRRPAFLTTSLAFGVVVAACVTGMAPAQAGTAAAPTSYALASYDTSIESIGTSVDTAIGDAHSDADAAITQADTAVSAAASVTADVAASGLDVGDPNPTVDTTALQTALTELREADTVNAPLLPALTEHVTELVGPVDERANQLRGSLDGAKAKAAEEEAARVAAEAAAAAEAEKAAAAAAAKPASSGSSAPLPAPSGGGSGDNSPAGAQATARGMLAGYGWGDDQFGCLVSLWNKESGWNYRASNGGSGAYGIPQALPGSKMASAGADWQTNAATQIAWGLGYISGRYGSPCGAWSHSQSVGWY
ncbi:lytic transglycosylase domain-containing protein [Microbacterium sp. cx-55]|uniref:aggregation-promoting factor C-terminal-like domain-containing protein n=1 Tax=unclassified Microbacterium TaxID=2609290 RepID=UPI001CBB2DAF|nr:MULTISPECIES: lytic transglycosylase domain-containing protein [unclassified Microbacterium]MBZ4488399.1 lytic transglycosylase domain-containing protein [Microbacterium sp. cx-55]MCC4909538.1 lytic transglycosylase domain-containing protein [Microbacterium sp. cx-59]UGB35051.1 lytic transglycosylase domain-containing protein [Microbacterium sp. cx-55]